MMRRARDVQRGLDVVDRGRWTTDCRMGETVRTTTTTTVTVTGSANHRQEEYPQGINLQ